MSIDVRWFTNGEKKIYWVRDAVAETVNIYDALEQVPKSIRHYAEKIKNPQVCEPDLARYFGVQRYITILNINGKHSYRLAPLINKLALPTLVIADLDSAEPTGHHKKAEPVRKQF